MSRFKNSFVVGVFVSGALIVAVASVALFGSGRFFTETVQCVMFFKGSVKGLTIGSPVMFRGVKVGSVSSISIYTDPEALEFTIPVVVDFDTRQMVVSSSAVTSGEASLEQMLGVGEQGVLDRLIGNGLRARLDLQSFVTGQLVITLDFYPDTRPVLHERARLPEIPTISSAMEEVAKTLEQIPVKELAGRFANTLQAVDRLVSRPETQALPAELLALAQEARLAVSAAERLMRDTHAVVEPLGKKSQDVLGRYGSLADTLKSQTEETAVAMRASLDALEAAARRSEKAMEGVEALTAPDAAIVRDMREALRELTGAARSLRVWADYLERHPEALIRGKGEYRR
ncbi:MlaD family protein [Oleidesulfovibrio alaskensis]|uniref:MlaD family protein n=1 Tax=Oleidesulfovibrio alaskensis TaxID=58180 RepID=UPI001A439414|nr:MlaD family protein [Oleidesulfovibrio alaskensis]MBL3582660.1 MCE family protein [Oleidesulfovibrio alaskensis]